MMPSWPSGPLHTLSSLHTYGITSIRVEGPLPADTLRFGQLALVLAL